MIIKGEETLLTIIKIKYFKAKTKLSCSLKEMIETIY